MISLTSFTRESIVGRLEYFKTGNKRANCELIEKVIYALYLLEGLKKQEIEFIFKGGTSLLLLLSKIHRFSIDIDIIIGNTTNKEKLEGLFEKICNSGEVFYRFEGNFRENPRDIPKAHYKFYYKSELDSREKYVMLDILFEENPYSNLMEKEIKGEFILTEGENLKVYVPQIECILGDKLTAFAPNTTGIMYGMDKELEIIKQLFDIANLFDEVKYCKTIEQTFLKIVENELGYRGLTDINYENVLMDTFETCIIIAFRGAIEKEKYRELENGIQKMRGYTAYKNYIIEDAVLDAGKVAYLVLLLKYQHTEIEHYDNLIEVEKLNITNVKFIKGLKSIKKFSPEAYYYWYKAIELYDIHINEEVSDAVVKDK